MTIYLSVSRSSQVVHGLPDDGGAVQALGGEGGVPCRGGGDLHRTLLSFPALLVAVNTGSVTEICIIMTTQQDI